MEKFDIEKHAIDNYIDNDNAYIKVLLDNNDDIYNLKDPRKKTISSDISSYITNKSREIPFKYKIIIEFFTSNISDAEKENIRKIVKEYYGFMTEEKRRIIKSNRLKSLALIFFGALMLSIALLTSNLIGPLFNEIIYVIGWVLIWEGTETCLLSNSSEKIKCKNYKQLYDAEIIFSDKLEIKD